MPLAPALNRDTGISTGLLVGLVVGISVLMCCIIALGYRRWKNRRKLKPQYMNKQQRKDLDLFNLIDADSSGFIDTAELKHALDWVEKNIPNGKESARVMLMALDEEDDDEAAGAPNGAPKGAPVPRPAEEGSIGEGNQKIDEVKIDLREEGRMDTTEFQQWVNKYRKQLTAKSVEYMHLRMAAYFLKRQQTIRLFKAYDDDNSGTLEVDEIRGFLSVFKEKAKLEVEKFEVENEVTISKEMADGKKTFAGWTDNVLASLDHMATKSKKVLTLPEFELWLLDVSGHLSEATFTAAYTELMEVINKEVSTKMLFKLWDKDNSGSLDFVEIGHVMKFLSDNVGSLHGIKFSDVLAAIPEPVEGRLSFTQFDGWMKELWGVMNSQQYTVFMEKIKDRLRAIGEDPDGTTAMAAQRQAEPESGSQGAAAEGDAKQLTC